MRENAIRFNLITFRFQLIRWSAILTGIGLPILAWIIASDIMDLRRITAIEITLVVILISIGILKLVSNYLMDGFVRSYMDSDNWDYLSARFGVARLPAELRAAPGLEGFGQLDRDDVVFPMDIKVSDSTLYINTQPFGRLVVPWESVVMLHRQRLMTDYGLRDTAAITLDGPDCALTIPWTEHFDVLVPQSVGIS